MGHSRGGLLTKINFVVNENKLPIGFILTGGGVHDVLEAIELLSGEDCEVCNRG